MTPSWQVMGGGKREFHRAKDAKAAKSQRDAMTIAQPFMACLYPHVFWIWIMLVNMQ